MELRLLNGFDRAERHAVPVGFDHDPDAYLVLKFEYVPERMHHMLHGIYIVVMEQDLVQWHMERAVINDRACSRPVRYVERGHRAYAVVREDERADIGFQQKNSTETRIKQAFKDVLPFPLSNKPLTRACQYPIISLQ